MLDSIVLVVLVADFLILVILAIVERLSQKMLEIQAHSLILDFLSTSVWNLTIRCIRQDIPSKHVSELMIQQNEQLLSTVEESLAKTTLESTALQKASYVLQAVEQVFTDKKYKDILENNKKSWEVNLFASTFAVALVYFVILGASMVIPRFFCWSLNIC